MIIPHEHFVAHKLLAEENPEDLGIQQAWFILARYKGKFITAEEYEDLRIKRLKVLSSEKYRFKQSLNASGRKWYNNGIKSVFTFEKPEGYIEGRCASDKVAIGKASKGRQACKGRHWYNNGNEQKMLKECPEGWVEGTLPMSESAKKAHSEAMKNLKDHPCKHINRGYETLNEVLLRIDFESFKNDFVEYKMSDDDLAIKYNCTKRMIEKYRRHNKLFKELQNENS